MGQHMEQEGKDEQLRCQPCGMGSPRGRLRPSSAGPLSAEPSALAARGWAAGLAVTTGGLEFLPCDGEDLAVSVLPGGS